MTQEPFPGNGTELILTVRKVSFKFVKELILTKQMLCSHGTKYFPTLRAAVELSHTVAFSPTLSYRLTLYRTPPEDSSDLALFGRTLSELLSPSSQHRHFNFPFHLKPWQRRLLLLPPTASWPPLLALFTL